MKNKSESAALLEDLKWRGLIHQTTDDARLGPWLAERSRTVYAGFDPTADSLHVGSLHAADDAAAVSAGRASADRGGRRRDRHDRRSQRQERGAQPAVARSSSRATSPAWQRRCGGSSTSTPAPHAALLVNNYDWTAPFSYLEFLRDVGKNFPVNVMLAKDSVKSRLGRGDDDAGISYTEFSYMLLQAYDFVHLHEQSRLRAAGRRQRPVGQHHRRHRPGPADARRAAVRPHLPAAHQERRHEDGQDRERRRLAVGRADEPLRVLSVLDQRRRRRRGQVPAVADRA